MLIIAGAVLILTGLIFSGKFGIGRLPGDIVVSRPGFTFYFPIVTMILVSAVLSIIFWLMRK